LSYILLCKGMVVLGEVGPRGSWVAVFRRVSDRVGLILGA